MTTPEGDVLSPKLTYRVVLVGRNCLAVAPMLTSRRHAEAEIDRLCATGLYTRAQLHIAPNMGAFSIEVIDE